MRVYKQRWTNASPNSCVSEATLKLASQTRDTTSLHKHWVQKDYKMLSLVHYTAILHMLPLTHFFSQKFLKQKIRQNIFILRCSLIKNTIQIV